MTNSESTKNVSSRRSFIKLVALGGGVLFFWGKMGGSEDSLMAQGLIRGGPYQGKKLRLNKDCTFVRLDEKSVVFDHKKRAHFTPQNESARIVLDLLSKNAGKGKGTSFDDLRNQLTTTFQTSPAQAEADLNAFLNELAGFGLLEHMASSDPVPPDPNYPARPSVPGEARGHITAGGTVVTCGYLLTWYRG
jgi:hypothetical protein